ncbi:O-antigen ligase family protein [Nocardioides allogilvus]|uniref:O-antigen ligase family protein n=1 Tax=Nocardioides allogilvus TaxID=2072017 RepID=UPI000D2FD420|nr:O-antigen ligase family protein [Nocardioides allogilvus]
MLALDFFFVSSPLVFEPVFDNSLRRAVLCTTIACVLSLPWLRLPRIPWSVAVFLAFAFASCFWSINQAFTVHFSGLYVVLAVLGVVVACNVETRALTHGVMLGAAVVVVTSIYAFWAKMPGAAVPPGSSGYLAGVGTNRNILAYAMIIAFALAVSFVPRSRALRAGWTAALLLIVSGIILAESATGIAALAALSAIALVLGARDHLASLGRQPGRRYWLGIGAMLTTLSAVSIGWYESLHRDIQRDLSITGRVQIWEAAWSASAMRVRVIGDGWGSVWPHPWRPAPPNGAFDEIVLRVGHTVAHGHNSAMDLVPELGVVGVGLFALVYLQTVARALRQRRGLTTPAARERGRLGILGVAGLLLAGVTEPISVVPLGFFVAVLIAAHLYPGRTAQSPRSVDAQVS